MEIYKRKKMLFLLGKLFIGFLKIFLKKKGIYKIEEEIKLFLLIILMKFDNINNVNDLNFNLFYNIFPINKYYLIFIISIESFIYL